tara:strand:+ start:7191 stop:9392 length:2202 start_codon:yes stop_codon:yes gene_type:complete
MKAATYRTISGENLLDNYKVHYYFDTYTGAGSNTHIYSDGDSQYSGKIFSYEGGSHSSDALNLFTGDLGTGAFSGGAGDFYDHVTIANSSDLFSGEFSFLIGAQTTSRQDVGIEEGDASEENQKGPLTNNNILFSNMGGSEFNYSGWQLGINAANRAYVECNHNFQPLITTYMGQQNPYQQNIWGLVYQGGQLKLGLYDINTENFSFETLDINASNIESTRPWIIGSGINYDANATFSPFVTANSGLFAGKMNNFLYFNTGLTDDLISTIAQSLYSELDETTQPIYDTGGTGLVLGHLTGSGISGEVGIDTRCSITGYLTATVGFKEKTELLGTPSVGDTYYLEVDQRDHPISGVIKNYRALYYTGGLTPPLITGFTITNHTTGYLTPLTDCSGSGITGAFITGSGTAGSGISGFTGLLVSGVSGLSGAVPGPLKPNALSYIGTPIQYAGVVEKHNMGSFGIEDKGMFNNLANVGEAMLTDGYAFYLKKLANSGSLGLYLNGVGRELGGISLRSSETSRVFFDSNLNKTFAVTNLPPPSGILDKDNFAADSDVIKTYFNNYNIISGDYYISGSQILETLPLPFSNKDILDIYDTGLNTGVVRTRWEVTGLSDYLAPSNPIDPDQWVFFNGQKLVSGINFEPNGLGQFIPSGYITGITGTYFTIPGPSGDQGGLTGTSLSFEGTSFFPNSNVIFINGVRQDLSESYIEHTNTKDLISGKETLKNYGSNLYNNYS